MPYDSRLLLDISESHIVACSLQKQKLNCITCVPHQAAQRQDIWDGKALRRPLELIMEKANPKKRGIKRICIGLCREESSHRRGKMLLQNLPLEREDVDRIVQHVAGGVPEDKFVVATDPMEYSIDGRSYGNPTGISGNACVIRLHLILTPKIIKETIEEVLSPYKMEISFVGRLHHTAHVLLPKNVQKHITLLLDFDHLTTGALLFGNRESLHITHIPLGDRNIVQDLTQILKRSPKEAVRIKNSEGHMPLQKTDIREGSYSDYVSAIIGARVEETVNLLQKKLHQATEMPVLNQVLIMGPGSTLPDLDLYLEKKFEAYTTHLRVPEDPSVPIPPSSMGPIYAMAFRAPEKAKALEFSSNRWRSTLEWIRSNF